MARLRPVTALAAAIALLLVAPAAGAHPETWLPRYAELARRDLAGRDADASLTLALVDAETGEPLAGNVRVLRVADGAPLHLGGLHRRPGGWHALPEARRVRVASGRLRVEGFDGLHTSVGSVVVDLPPGGSARAAVPLRRFADPAARGLKSANTHLHLADISMAAARSYLQEVGRADDLDAVWVSYLERTGMDARYVSNRFDAASLRALSTPATRFGWGEELRHNFGPYAIGYGHVLFLEIPSVIEPAALGPQLGITPTDGTPLRDGIDRAHAAGATVIWAHNTAGYEDAPNWVAGRLDAQNVFDGSSEGTFADGIYRYQNIGLRIPLSTGTDWFIRDLSRVLVLQPGPTDPAALLAALRAGRTQITNGPLLEITVDGRGPGETVALGGPSPVRVVARAVGRRRFDALEVVGSGAVVGRAAALPRSGYFEARISLDLAMNDPGWFAARIDPGPGRSDFGSRLFGHTSSVYVEMAGRRPFRADTARHLLLEMDWNQRDVLRKGVFHDAAERSRVGAVYDDGIARLEPRLPLSDRVSVWLVRRLRDLRDLFLALFD